MKNKRISDIITITLNYNNKDLAFTTKRFNKLSKVKEKAFQLFYPIKSDIILKYNNKDLSEFLEQSIGLIFENKTRIKIKIEPQIGTQRLIKKLIFKSYKNIFNRNSEIDKQPLSADKYNSLITETTNRIKYNRKLPPIKNNISSNFLENNLEINIFTYKICKDCTRKKTNNFCRNCNEFICLNCTKKRHKNHPIIELDLNNEKSNIEKYKNELINKFSSTINDLDKLEKIEKEELSEDEWKQKYNKAINNLTQIIQKNLQKLTKNNNNEENNNKKDENKEFKKQLKEEKNSINNIVISINKDPFKIFKEINEKEKFVRKLIQKNKNENNKIDEIFCQIENEIDDIIYNLEENIFSKIDY